MQVLHSRFLLLPYISLFWCMPLYAVQAQDAPQLIERLPSDIRRLHGLNPDVIRTFVPQMVITISAVEPSDVWEQQDFIVQYTVTNLTTDHATGRVQGFVDVDPLPSSPTLDLQPGQSTSGQFHVGARPLGTHRILARYTDKIRCHSVPSWTGGSREICVAEVIAEDTVNITIRGIRNILSSSDVLNRQEPAEAHLCGDGTSTYPNIGVSFEWADVPNGADVPALGYVIGATGPGKDVPWSHPFGSDYSFGLVLDRKFWPLLNARSLESAANCTSSGIDAGLGDRDTCSQFAPARALGYVDSALGVTPDVGILHTEIENGLIPAFFKPVDGDRVYMRGRHIVDCGTIISPPSCTHRRLSPLHVGCLTARYSRA
jgi:hypothetical protein